MGILRFRVEERKAIVFGTAFASFIRNTTEVKDINIAYSGATAQSVSANQVLYNYLTPSDVGFIEVKALASQVLNGNGVLNTRITHRSSSSQVNQDVVFSLFNSQVTLQFSYNSKPVAEDIIIDITNRSVYVFQANDFIDHFTDDDLDALASVSIYGNVAGYTINGSQYIEGESITISAIESGLLVYNALSQDAYYETDNTWKAKDINGNESN